MLEWRDKLRPMCNIINKKAIFYKCALQKEVVAKHSIIVAKIEITLVISDKKTPVISLAFVITLIESKLITRQGSYVILQNGLGGVIYAVPLLQSDEFALL